MLDHFPSHLNIVFLLINGRLLTSQVSLQGRTPWLEDRQQADWTVLF